MVLLYATFGINRFIDGAEDSGFSAAIVVTISGICVMRAAVAEPVQYGCHMIVTPNGGGSVCIGIPGLFNFSGVLEAL